MKRPILPMLLLVAAASAALAFTAGRAAPPTPVIAVVNVPKVLDSLEERLAREAAIRTFGEQLQKDFDAKKKQLQDDMEAAKILPEGPDRDARNEELASRTILVGREGEVAEWLLKRRGSHAIQELYLKIDAAAAELAKSQGYTIVLSSDENVPIPKEDVDQRTMALKRMLYIDERHDITDELIRYMNNQFAAGGGKPAAKK